MTPVGRKSIDAGLEPTRSRPAMLVILEEESC
jgi:hypothetical protein